MSKETFYFSHDYNARSDDKIKRLIRVHGMPGYGVFWAIVEDLYNNANALHTDYEGIAYDLRVNSEIVKSIINDFELFCFENGSFGSTSVERRLDERNLKSEKARKSAFKRWDKNKDNANAMQTHSEGNAINESKVKESKVKEIEIYTFEEFWNDYSKKDGMKKCKDKWVKISNTDKLKIKEHVPKYVLSTPEVQYRKNPLTYLNGECWNDEIKCFKEKPAPIDISKLVFTPTKLKK